MLLKNQTVSLECTGLGVDFEGVCRHEGQVVFVPGMLPAERAAVKIIKVTKSYAVGRLERLLAFSAERVTPRCPYYPRCGGCTAQHLSYEATLRYKQKQVLDCLRRIGGFEDARAALPLGMEDPWRYRNKGAFPVGGEAAAPRIGCFAARSHEIVDAPAGCLLQTEGSDALVKAVRWWMARGGVPPYDEGKHSGLVRHVMTRQARGGGMMLVVVVNGRQVPHGGELIAAARDACPSLQSIVIAENTSRTNVILGERFHTLWGCDALDDEIAGFRMRVSPRSFFQVNRDQAERLYAEAIRLCGLTGRERVWDLYCGCGSITLPLARRAESVTGVEIVEDAVRDARANAKRNGVVNAGFAAGAVEAVLPVLAARQGKPDVVVLDPP
ncbi:MAG: 23S rRNA (uracil(1939)-C(5))-methyltransferase RlmD, partial [Firmicutes bacterium]|nr:23S rRNA (uracil(1939)-C(5))-methyltransferase RlmD [Bacillota bacterium]